MARMRRNLTPILTSLLVREFKESFSKVKAQIAQGIDGLSRHKIMIICSRTDINS